MRYDMSSKKQYRKESLFWKNLEKRTNYRQLEFKIRERRPGLKVKVVSLVISALGGGIKKY